MSAPKGIAAVEWLARRSKEQRGGNAPKPDGFERGTPDALALCKRPAEHLLTDFLSARSSVS